MGLFDIFKKKNEPHYDSTDIRVKDLDVGFVFDYDLSNWEVQQAYEYDWGDSYFSDEYKISDGEKTLYLSVEDDDELILSVSKKLKIKKLGSAILEELMSTQKPPASFEYENEKFVMEEEAPGYFHDRSKGKDDWEEFVSWTYTNESGDKLITIEQWDEKEFEASIGKYIKEFEISHILPATEG